MKFLFVPLIESKQHMLIMLECTHTVCKWIIVPIGTGVLAKHFNDLAFTWEISRSLKDNTIFMKVKTYFLYYAPLHRNCKSFQVKNINIPRRKHKEISLQSSKIFLSPEQYFNWPLISINWKQKWFQKISRCTQLLYKIIVGQIQNQWITSHSDSQLY